MLRRPCGADLRRWHALQPDTRAQALQDLLDTLVVAGQAAADDEAALSEAFTAHDPLLALAVGCECPACGAANEVAVDLESIALARLAARQHALLHEIHRLASHYGWTEAEVLAVPPTRRARYLAFIEAER